VAGLLAEVREVSATEREVPQGLFGALLGGGTSLEAASLLRQVVSLRQACVKSPGAPRYRPDLSRGEQEDRACQGRRGGWRCRPG